MALLEHGSTTMRADGAAARFDTPSKTTTTIR
jgi:hypothetical protein